MFNKSIVTLGTAILVAACSGATGNTPSNADNEKLIFEYLLKHDVSFTEGYLVLKSVSCNDKSVQDSRMTAICKISVEAKQGYAPDSSVGMRWGRIKVGDTSTVDREYIFQKFESGWKIRS